MAGGAGGLEVGDPVALGGDGGGGTVAGMDDKGWGQGGEAVEGFQHQVRVGAGEIDAPVGTGEEGVAGDQYLVFVG